MAGLASLLPRFVALPLLALLGTATLTYAANTQLTTPETPAQPAAASVPSVLVVPDVRRQAFVFAKGTLEDAGFGWAVAGPIKGFAANTVVSQYPEPGVRVVDNGSPAVRVTLATNSGYSQKGSPENAAPYGGTRLRVAGAGHKAPAAKPKTEQPAAPKPAKAKPAKTTAEPSAKRTPAFAIPGAPAEPLDEMALPDRARLLNRYVSAHPDPTPAAINHFLYQHAWIVTGAEFGWSRGSEALQLLIAVDRRASKIWGIGSKSESVARSALTHVAAKSR